MDKLIKVLFVLTISLVSTLVLAEDQSHISYDSIVEELSSSRTTSTYRQGNPFQDVLIHSGVGLALVLTSLERQKQSYQGILQGVEINMGIDLFSKTWMAEGSFRTLGDSTFEDNIDVKLTEFDLKFVYHSRVSQLMRMRFDFGLAARYMDFNNNIDGLEHYTTPSSIASLGLEAQLSRNFTFGATVSYRSAITEDTIDNSSINTSLRLDTHF